MSGWLRLWAGDLDVAIEHFETAFRLSLRERDGAHCMGIGEAQFLQRRFNEAIITLLNALEALPEHAESTAISLPAMRIWDGSTKRERWSGG